MIFISWITRIVKSDNMPARFYVRIECTSQCVLFNF
jgi:hypothetical protein